ncbi:hypothetical protein WN944_010819 [Citrus x changshan-huyou]|uniref:Uncharacterized protein n=1 Tax=Citrus x changshan-huyou TaxID=2935761 RepID=A0AAP0MUF3_9ROSI
MARFVQQDHYKVQSPTFFIGLKPVISREGKGRKKYAFCHLLTNKQNNKSMNCSTSPPGQLIMSRSSLVMLVIL